MGGGGFRSLNYKKKVENYNFLKAYLKKEKITKFSHTEIENQKLYQQKELISIKNIAINKIAVCNKVSLSKKGFKYFIGYNHAQNIRPLCIILQKMTAYRIDYDQTKHMSF